MSQWNKQIEKYPKHNFELVWVYSKKKRSFPLVVLGVSSMNKNMYHKEIFEVASDQTLLLGVIFSMDEDQAIRFPSLLYVHEHSAIGATQK